MGAMELASMELRLFLMVPMTCWYPGYLSSYRSECVRYLRTYLSDTTPTSFLESWSSTIIILWRFLSAMLLRSWPIVQLTGMETHPSMYGGRDLISCSIFYVRSSFPEFAMIEKSYFENTSKSFPSSSTTGIMESWLSISFCITWNRLSLFFAV